MAKIKQAEAREQVLRIIEEQNIKFISLCFTDILGFLKSLTITRDELERVLGEGIGFDGSSIEGFARIDESDMLALPDPTTFTILPQGQAEPEQLPLFGQKSLLQEYPVARMFCDILMPSGEPFEGDPRYVLKANLKRAQDMGYMFYVGPELEYFYFRGSETPQQLDSGGYFDLTPPDIASDLRQETVLTLQEMGIGVEYVGI